MDWARILAFVTGMVDQELLARIEYLAAENRILKAQLKRRLKLSDAERATLGEILEQIGDKCSKQVDDRKHRIGWWSDSPSQREPYRIEFSGTAGRI